MNKMIYVFTFTMIFIHSVRTLIGVFTYDTETVFSGIKGILMNIAGFALCLYLNGELFLHKKEK